MKQEQLGDLDTQVDGLFGNLDKAVNHLGGVATLRNLMELYFSLDEKGWDEPRFGADGSYTPNKVLGMLSHKLEGTDTQFHVRDKFAMLQAVEFFTTPAIDTMREGLKFRAEEQLHSMKVGRETRKAFDRTGFFELMYGLRDTAKAIVGGVKSTADRLAEIPEQIRVIQMRMEAKHGRESAFEELVDMLGAAMRVGEVGTDIESWQMNKSVLGVKESRYVFDFGRKKVEVVLDASQVGGKQDLRLDAGKEVYLGSMRFAEDQEYLNSHDLLLSLAAKEAGLLVVLGEVGVWQAPGVLIQLNQIKQMRDWVLGRGEIAQKMKFVDVSSEVKESVSVIKAIEVAGVLGFAAFLCATPTIATPESNPTQTPISNIEVEPTQTPEVVAATTELTPTEVSQIEVRGTDIFYGREGLSQGSRDIFDAYAQDVVGRLGSNFVVDALNVKFETNRGFMDSSFLFAADPNGLLSQMEVSGMFANGVGGIDLLRMTAMDAEGKLAYGFNDPAEVENLVASDGRVILFMTDLPWVEYSNTSLADFVWGHELTFNPKRVNMNTDVKLRRLNVFGLSVEEEKVEYIEADVSIVSEEQLQVLSPDQMGTIVANALRLKHGDGSNQPLDKVSISSNPEINTGTAEFESSPVITGIRNAKVTVVTVDGNSEVSGAFWVDMIVQEEGSGYRQVSGLMLDGRNVGIGYLPGQFLLSMSWSVLTASEVKTVLQQVNQGQATQHLVSLSTVVDEEAFQRFLNGPDAKDQFKLLVANALTSYRRWVQGEQVDGSLEAYLGLVGVNVGSVENLPKP